jgi:hypothetical protein
MRSQLSYLDPGSGSYLLQLLIAGLLGALFVLRGYLGRVKDFILGIFTRAEAKPSPLESTGDENQEDLAADQE